MTRRILRIVAYVVVDLFEAAMYFIAIGLLTALLGLMLPLTAAFAIALLGVSTCFGYRRARLIERTRKESNE